MDDGLKLTVLKQDLQKFTNANDGYLKTLLELAKKAIIREGIELSETDEDIEKEMAVIHYAAYLYRKRAGTDTSMPRYLRYELNNLLFSQKARGDAKNDI